VSGTVPTSSVLRFMVGLYPVVPRTIGRIRSPALARKRVREATGAWRIADSPVQASAGHGCALRRPAPREALARWHAHRIRDGNPSKSVSWDCTECVPRWHALRHAGTQTGTAARGTAYSSWPSPPRERAVGREALRARAASGGSPRGLALPGHPPFPWAAGGTRTQRRPDRPKGPRGPLLQAAWHPESRTDLVTPLPRGLLNCPAPRRLPGRPSLLDARGSPRRAEWCAPALPGEGSRPPPRDGGRVAGCPVRVDARDC